jgi:hypothetical protein
MIIARMHCRPRMPDRNHASPGAVMKDASSKLTQWLQLQAQAMFAAGLWIVLLTCCRVL